MAVYHAYQVVEDVKAEAVTERRKLPAAEKVAEGLRAADAWMVANSWRPLKPGEQERAGWNSALSTGSAAGFNCRRAPSPARWPR